MPSDLKARRFPDENKWPFIGRDRDLERCLAFLRPDDTLAPSRLLHLVGESGAGKSFFVKELICRFTERATTTMGLYINVEESEFESTQLEKRLALLASYPAEPTRSDPQHVPINAELAKYLRPLPKRLRAIRYAYGGVREATTEIPLFGKVLNALLPSALPVSKRRELAVAGRFWDFLITTAERDPVLLVIDNFQFLPDSVAMELDGVLAVADTGFRLVVVERLSEGVSDAWKLRCFGNQRMTVEMAAFSPDQTRNLVGTVLGESTPRLPDVSDVIFRKSGGNPKQIWLQLRAYELNRNTQLATVPESRALQLSRAGQPVETVIGSYDETIKSLPSLDRLALQLVTLVMGGLKVDDIVGILRSMVHPLSEEDVRKAILDLALVGLLIVNGAQNNRVRTEHELVSRSVRRLTTEEEAHELRMDVVSALSLRLEYALDDEEYERLVDRLVGLITPEELRRRHDLLAHMIALIDRQHSKERFHYLAWLFGTPSGEGVVDILPPHCLEAFLDAFQKTSQFDKGLAAVELMRVKGKVTPRKLSLFAAMYLVQKFEYGQAESLLRSLEAGTDRDVILFNILLNLCRDSEAKRMIEPLHLAQHLDEFQCVILRNSSHLYDENTARGLLLRARDGFKRLGLNFGEATTQNNLGVLEMWAGRYDDAQRHLTAARATLDAIGSNEVYQPLTNLAVLQAVEGDLTTARQLLDRARTVVSSGLRMDEIMLRFNLLTIELIEGSVSGTDAAARAVELYERSLRTMDMRFRAVLSWFASQMETLFNGSSSIPVPPNFDSEIRTGRNSGLEIFSDVMVGDIKVTVVFVLSPHWRY